MVVIDCYGAVLNTEPFIISSMALSVL